MRNLWKKRKFRWNLVCFARSPAGCFVGVFCVNVCEAWCRCFLSWNVSEKLRVTRSESCRLNHQLMAQQNIHHRGPKASETSKMLAKKNHIKQKPELEVLVVCKYWKELYVISDELKTEDDDDGSKSSGLICYGSTDTYNSAQPFVFTFHQPRFSVAFSWPMFLNREIFSCRQRITILLSAGQHLERVKKSLCKFSAEEEDCTNRRGNKINTKSLAGCSSWLTSSQSVATGTQVDDFSEFYKDKRH